MGNGGNGLEDDVNAAFGAVRILCVGPDGVQGKLDRVSLKIRDFKLRPDIIFNFLAIKYALHGGHPAPTIARVEALIAFPSRTPSLPPSHYLSWSVRGGGPLRLLLHPCLD